MERLARQPQAAQAGVPRAEADLAKADATEHARESYQISVAAHEAAQQEVNQAQAQLSKARQGVISAQSLLEHSEGYLLSAKATGLEVGVRETQFASAQASVQQATAALEDAKMRSCSSPTP
jgi:hypothetical protein